MKFTKENVMKLLERHITDYDTEIRARSAVFSVSGVGTNAELAEDFARRAAELSRCGGALQELRRLMDYIDDMTEDQPVKNPDGANILIYVSGGLVQSVVTNAPNAHVTVYDADTEEFDDAAEAEYYRLAESPEYRTIY